jgi:predicted CXXCH cytochrome family protein
LLLALAAVLFVLWPGSAAALARHLEPAAQGALPPAAMAPQALPLAQGGPPADDSACRQCHDGSGAAITFPRGETLSVDVDPGVIEKSVHGEELNCTSCHAPATYQFPHPTVEADSLREYEIARSLTCERCHQDPHITSHPGRDADNPVVCTDCHGSHDVHAADEWLDTESIAFCANCHEQRGVEFTSGSRLHYVVENGMFAERPDNDYCLSCHSLTNFSMSLDSGEKLFLTVDEEQFHDSVHGVGNEWQPLACLDCHEGYVFPHDPVLAETLREYTVEKQTVCAECHEDKMEETADSVHAVALDRGVEEAAVCTDCHGSHYVPPPAEPRSRISQTCRQCHSTIFNEYAQSVHGEALLEEDNPDVAVCTDCHGVHQIANPNLAAFRVSSPRLCGKCHGDEQLMAKYDISTDVFETYVADFHGTTVTLFEIQDPTAETNKAVCYDCHGVHDIRPPDDPNSGIKENLLTTCQKCHPNASTNFPDSWLSHYRPSLQHHPAVFLVQTFYQIIIPGTAGLLLFLVGTDIYRRMRRR